MKPLFHIRDWAVAQAAVAALLFFSIPLVNLLMPGERRWISTVHGLGALLTVALACQMVHRLYPYLHGAAGSARRLERIVWLTTALALLTIVFGNWLYMSYRLPDQAQQWLIYHMPFGHSVLMEYKEFVALFPFPLGVVCAFILRRSPSDAPGGEVVSAIVALLATFMWMSLLIAAAAGLMLAKLKMV